MNAVSRSDQRVSTLSPCPPLRDPASRFSAACSAAVRGGGTVAAEGQLKLFVTRRIERSEAASGSVLENALATFIEQGYLQRASGKLALIESFSSEEAAQAIEARVAADLLRGAGDAA